MINKKFIIFLILSAVVGCSLNLQNTSIEKYPYNLKLKNNSLAGWSFVIDPGHGGNEKGALSAIKKNSPESDVNLSLSFLLGGMLKSSGAEVTYTRTADIPASDTFLPLKYELKKRSEYSDKIKPDFFISIHHNSSSNKRLNKIELYYKLFSQGPSEKLSGYIADELSKLYSNSKKEIYAGNYSVLRNSNSEAILIESSYLSNKKVAKNLEQIKFLKEEAAAIYQGILNYSVNGLPFIETEYDTGNLNIKVTDHLKIKKINITVFNKTPIYKTFLLAEDTYVTTNLSLDKFEYVNIEAINENDIKSNLIFRNPAKKMFEAQSPFFLLVFDTSYKNINKFYYSDTSITFFPIYQDKNPSITLKQIEQYSPKYAIIINKSKSVKLYHYYRSSTGKKLAYSFNHIYKKSRIIPASHYLLTHTSMAALEINSDIRQEALFTFIKGSCLYYLKFKDTIKPESIKITQHIKKRINF